MELDSNIKNDITDKVRELEQQFDIKYQEVCNLNQERFEKSTP